MIKGTTTLKMNNSPSYEVQASYEVFPLLRALTYPAKKPNPITSQSVNTATTIVGVFISQIVAVFPKTGKTILKAS
jgi:hypothetical protein